jgi:hypothetical protein
MGQSMLVVKVEATAKNSSRLKHCVVVCDTTHQLFVLWLLHSTFVLILKDRHQPSSSVNVPHNLPPLPKTSSHPRYLLLKLSVIKYGLLKICELKNSYFILS